MKVATHPIRLAAVPSAATPRDRLLRLPEVEALTGCKKTTIYKYIKEDRFPRAVRMSRNFVVWPESAVMQWIQERIQQGAVHG